MRRQFSRLQITKSFNPCFSGSCSRDIFKNLKPDESMSLSSGVLSSLGQWWRLAKDYILGVRIKLIINRVLFLVFTDFSFLVVSHVYHAPVTLPVYLYCFNPCFSGSCSRIIIRASYWRYIYKLHRFLIADIISYNNPHPESFIFFLVYISMKVLWVLH